MVNGIESLKNLEFLDLSFNEIKKLDFLKDMKQLIQLEMLSNLITNVTGVNWEEQYVLNSIQFYYEKYIYLYILY